jgi:hypothetical protein
VEILFGDEGVVEVAVEGNPHAELVLGRSGSKISDFGPLEEVV